VNDLYGRLLFAWYWGGLRSAVAGVTIALVLMAAVIIFGMT